MAINEVICDFDGTLTDSEASLGEFFPTYKSFFIERLGIDADSYYHVLKIIQEELKEDPNAGWERDGYIVAPINSDPFAFNTASHMALLRALREGRFEGQFSISYIPSSDEEAGELTNSCHLAGYKKKNIVFRDGAHNFVEALMEEGYSVSIVSNSGTLDIEKALEDNNFPKISVIGMARKYNIDSSFTDVPSGIILPGLDRPVLLRRKLYDGVLNNLCSNVSTGVVVADNFELDLALPLYLGFAGILTNTPAAAQHEKDYMNTHVNGMYANNFEQALEFIRER
jgi:FMN phosphatase YigB (HAD superfamily)